jgi:hypothetical protein
MAWMGGAIAAAAYIDDGKRRRNPNKSVLWITIISLILGLFLPLFLFLVMSDSISFSFFPFIFILMFLIGMIMVVVVVGYSETQDCNDRRETTSAEYSDNSNYKPRQTYPYRKESREKYYWESEQKTAKMYCTNCGIRLNADDFFCSSCGWRAN